MELGTNPGLTHCSLSQTQEIIEQFKPLLGQNGFRMKLHAVEAFLCMADGMISRPYTGSSYQASRLKPSGTLSINSE